MTADPDPKSANAAQLKDDIDSGRTGDKVGGFDPAAAPLGTDEEAGGTTLDPQAMAQARADETRARPSGAHANAATPELQPDGSRRSGPMLIPMIAGVLIAVALAAMLFAAL